MSKHNIMIVKIDHRMNAADALQKLLSEYGCSIKTRLGLHEAGDACANDGLVILQLVDGQSDLEKFCGALNAIAGITAELVRI